jgi:hypothetical protein
MIPPVVETAILNWITDMPVAELRQLAQSQASLAARLDRERGWQLPMARHLLSAEDLAAIAAMDEADFESLLDVLLQDAPDHGVVCWQHKDWYLAQMAAVQALFVARTSRKRRQGGAAARYT